MRTSFQSTNLMINVTLIGQLHLTIPGRVVVSKSLSIHTVSAVAIIIMKSTQQSKKKQHHQQRQQQHEHEHVDTGMIKLKITSDDNCTIVFVCNNSLSIKQVIQEYIKIRKIRYAFDATMFIDGIDVDDCILAKSFVDISSNGMNDVHSLSIPSSVTTQEYLAHDAAVIDFINRIQHGPPHEFTLFGFKAKQTMRSIQHLVDLSTQLSSISTMFNNTIDTVINQSNLSSSSSLLPAISNNNNEGSNEGIITTSTNTLMLTTAGVSDSSASSSIINYIVDRTDTYIADVTTKLTSSISEHQQQSQPQYQRLLKAKGTSRSLFR